MIGHWSKASGNISTCLQRAWNGPVNGRRVTAALARFSPDGQFLETVEQDLTIVSAQGVNGGPREYFFQPKIFRDADHCKRKQCLEEEECCQKGRQCSAAEKKSPDLHFIFDPQKNQWTTSAGDLVLAVTGQKK